jgi:hypothetical protein
MEIVAARLPLPARRPAPLDVFAHAGPAARPALGGRPVHAAVC